jgi:TonB family protein
LGFKADGAAVAVANDPTIEMKILALLVRFPSFITCVCHIGCAAQSFAADTDRAATAVERREGVTISGGDGSSYDKGIVVHAASLPQAMLAGFEYIALRYNWFQITSGSLVRHNGKSYKVLTYQDHRAMGDPKPKRVFYLDVTDYVPMYSFPPAYPREARDNGLTDKGVAVVKVDPATGHVTSVSMVKSTGHDILDNAALRAFRQWRFRPRGLTTFEITIQFTRKGVIY